MCVGCERLEECVYVYVVLRLGDGLAVGAVLAFLTGPPMPTHPPHPRALTCTHAHPPLPPARKDDPESFQLRPQLSYYPQFMFNFRRSQFIQAGGPEGVGWLVVLWGSVLAVGRPRSPGMPGLGRHRIPTTDLVAAASMQPAHPLGQRITATTAPNTTAATAANSCLPPYTLHPPPLLPVRRCLATAPTRLPTAG